MSNVPRTLAAVLLATLIAGCTESTGLADVAGTYDLATVSGVPVPTPGAASILGGTVTLTTFGSAERRVRYRDSAGGAELVDAASGTFHRAGQVLLLTLDYGSYSWSPTAAIVGENLTIQYGNPADGPDIVELYHRR
jgi:hypothetical protein